MGGPDAVQDDIAMGGPGAVQLHGNEQVAGEVTDFEGILSEASNGCVLVEVTTPTGDTSTRWPVWPRGSELADNGNLRLGDETFLAQDRITGTGQLVDLAALPRGQEAGSYFEGAGRYCGADSSGVVVIESMSRA